MLISSVLKKSLSYLLTNFWASFGSEKKIVYRPVEAPAFVLISFTVLIF